MKEYTKRLVYTDDFCRLFEAVIETNCIVDATNPEMARTLLSNVPIQKDCYVQYEPNKNKLILNINQNQNFKKVKIISLRYYDFKKGYEKIEKDGRTINVRKAENYVEMNVVDFCNKIHELYSLAMNDETFATEIRQQKIYSIYQKREITVPVKPSKKQNKIYSFSFERSYIVLKDNKMPKSDFTKYRKYINIRINASTKESILSNKIESHRFDFVEFLVSLFIK